MKDRLRHAIDMFQKWASKVESDIKGKKPSLRGSCQRLINWAKEIRELDEGHNSENIRSCEFSLLSRSIPVIYEGYAKQYLTGSRRHGQFTRARQDKVASYVYQFTTFLLPIAEEIDEKGFLREKIGEFISEYAQDLLFDLSHIGDHEADALLTLALKAKEQGIRNASSLKDMVESELLTRKLEEEFAGDLEGESVHVEYKEEIPHDMSKLSKEIAAFASTEGGRIYIGISDEARIVGVEPQEGNWLDKLQQRLMNHVYENIKPTPELSLDALPLRERIIIKISVKRGPEPMYYLRGVPYIRRLTTSRPATPSDVKNHYLRYFIEAFERSAL